MNYETTHAKHDRAHCMCPGLFRSFAKGSRGKQPLKVTYDYGEEKIEISGPELLGAFDLRVMQGLIALAGLAGLTIDMQQPKTETGERLVQAMEPVGLAVKEQAIAIRGSFYELAREIGLANPDGGKEARLIRDSIERIWKTSMIVEKGGRRRGYRLLGDGYESTGERGGRLQVSLNPRVATAILGGQHTRIDMREVRQLQTDPARLIHQRLCGFIDAGEGHPTPISETTLAGYVWHDAHAEPGSSTYRMRRKVIGAAMDDLAALGWTVEKQRTREGYVFKIGRPA